MCVGRPGRTQGGPAGERAADQRHAPVNLPDFVAKSLREGSRIASPLQLIHVRLALYRPGGIGTEAAATAPQPRVQQVADRWYIDLRQRPYGT